MNPHLQLKPEPEPKTVLTPLQQQGLLVLQLGWAELTAWLEEAVAGNPLLQLERPVEQPDDPAAVAAAGALEDWPQEDGDWPSRPGMPLWEFGRSLWDSAGPWGEDRYDDLVLQIRTAAVGPEVQRLALRLLTELDEHGFLPLPDRELAQLTGATTAQVNAARQLLQSLEPAGLGCFDLIDYLSSRLLAQGGASPEQVELLCQNLPQLLTEGSLRRLEDSQLERQLLQAIRRVPPPPGRSLAAADVSYLQPDLILQRGPDGFQVALNQRVLPRLSLDWSYWQQWQDRGPEVDAFLAENLRAARRLIGYLRQRNQTLLAVTLGIVAGQEEFFQRGPSALRPLTMQQVADGQGLHESTISRAVAGKYLQTPFGVYPLRYFFSSGVSGERGRGLAKAAVQAAIAELVAAEDPRQPYSDEALRALLEARLSIRISRRTVAKYREDAGILSSRRRKRWHM
jgi:RNA polymerase sigma-54 factor